MNGFAINKKRILKAKKIEKVLEDYLNTKIENFKILDVGAGNGEISAFFAKNNNVICVDIVDQRKNKTAKFRKVNNETLPFKINSFDIVISNHVIEHVNKQNVHLNEIKRVLKKKGIIYIATPNRMFPIEPHYKIPLIHYLPEYLFNLILKTFNLYKEPLHLLYYFSFKKKLKKRFKVTEYTFEIMKHPKKYFFKKTPLKLIPLFILKIFSFISPTNVFLCKKL